MSKNGEFIGERYVRLLRVPVTEMEEQSRRGTLAIPGKLRSRLIQQQQQQLQQEQQNRLAYLAAAGNLLGQSKLAQQAQPPPQPQLLSAPVYGQFGPIDTSTLW